MNERIRELYEQARLHAKSIDADIDPKGWMDEYHRKFAELIVRECMSMCDETQADYLKHRKATMDFEEKNIYAEGEAASDVIKYKMKKHFGIE